MAYPFDPTTFAVAVYGIIAWAAIMATFITGVAGWQLKQTIERHRGASGGPAQPNVIAGDD